MESDEIFCLIKRRRLQIIVHSAVYYRFNDNLISDHTFDAWCSELVQLQKDHPEIASVAPCQHEFDGFDGSTGFHLSTIPWGVKKAQELLEYRSKVPFSHHKEKSS